MGLKPYECLDLPPYFPFAGLPCCSQTARGFSPYRLDACHLLEERGRPSGFPINSPI